MVKSNKCIDQLQTFRVWIVLSQVIATHCSLIRDQSMPLISLFGSCVPWNWNLGSREPSFSFLFDSLISQICAVCPSCTVQIFPSYFAFQASPITGFSCFNSPTNWFALRISSNRTLEFSYVIKARRFLSFTSQEIRINGTPLLS